MWFKSKDLYENIIQVWYLQPRLTENTKHPRDSQRSHLSNGEDRLKTFFTWYWPSTGGLGSNNGNNNYLRLTSYMISHSRFVWRIDVSFYTQEKEHPDAGYGEVRFFQRGVERPLVLIPVFFGPYTNFFFFRGRTFGCSPYFRVRRSF